MTNAGEGSYAYKNVRSIQRERLRTLEELLDEGTIRHLEARGVEEGRRCLEIGAGGGSIAIWLSERVAPGGSVLATDLDTTVLADLSHPNLEIQVHDVLTDPLPDSAFDLVHLRLVLAWLNEPHRALRRLIAALRPGGWLLAEEMDFVSAVPDPRLPANSQDLVARAIHAHNTVLAQRHGFDPFYGRRLAGDLADAGLADIACEGRASMWHGGAAGGTIWRLSLTQLREPIIESGIITPADLDAFFALCDDRRSPRFPFFSKAGKHRMDTATLGGAFVTHQAVSDRSRPGLPDDPRARVAVPSPSCPVEITLSALRGLWDWGAG